MANLQLNTILKRRMFSRTIQNSRFTMWVKGTTGVKRYTDRSGICKTNNVKQVVEIIIDNNSTYYRMDDPALLEALSTL